MFHPDAWWLLKIPARQVSASLRLQWAVFLGIFLLLLGVPSLADLAIGGRAHLDLIEPSDLVFVAAQGFALLLFVWYFTRIEPADGWLGTRRIVPNLVCFALGLAAIPALHFFAFEAAHRALGDSPLRAPVVHGGPVGAAFTAFLMCRIPVEEISLRGFLLVRHRQAWGGIPQAIALSAALSGVASLDLGLDAALSAFLVGLWLAFLVSRWGGLAGVIAARLAAEWMIRRGVF